MGLEASQATSSDLVNGEIRAKMARHRLRLALELRHFSRNGFLLATRPGTDSSRIL